MFKWEVKNADVLHLKDISVDIKLGELVAITGPVGSGKSSLISALLGEMCKITGRASINVSWCLCSSSCYLPFLFVLQMHVLNKENKWFTLMMWLASVLILVFALMVTVNIIENLIIAAYFWSAFGLVSNAWNASWIQ